MLISVVLTGIWYGMGSLSTNWVSVGEGVRAWQNESSASTPLGSSQQNATKQELTKISRKQSRQLQDVLMITAALNLVLLVLLL